MPLLSPMLPVIAIYAYADALNASPELLVAKRMSNTLALDATDDDCPRLMLEDSKSQGRNVFLFHSR